MATEIPTQFGFQQLLSLTFPGFFSAITLFMLLDLWSPLDLTYMVFYKGLDGVIAFTGFILLIGSILGVIIDAFHHLAIESIFKENPNIKKCEREGFSYLKKCWDKNNLKKGKFEERCIFRWDDVGDAARDNDRLLSFLKRNFPFSFDYNERTKISKSPDNNSITIDDGSIKLERKDSKTIDIKVKDKSYEFNDLIASCNYCIIDNIDDNSKKSEKCPIYNLNRFYIFKEASDKLIAVHNYLYEQYYSYSEFYSNTFISLMAFSFVVPFYGYQVMHISFGNSICIAGISLILGLVCAIRSYAAYETYIKRINSVIRGYADAKTTNG